MSKYTVWRDHPLLVRLESKLMIKHQNRTEVCTVLNIVSSTSYSYPGLVTRTLATNT